MKKQVVYLDPMHTAKTLIIVYHVFTVPILLLQAIVEFFQKGVIPGLDLIGMLVVNAVVGFGLLWVACKAYNWVAQRFGGIEMELGETVDEQQRITKS
jgi:uncharacterized membrane-anchored protein